ncbi:lantibiotic dehydratase [Streptomyces sp. NPDC006798]|uniref:lantibiotic dehydratase n=1 Tax=Streptomyces sp. NPDC006798 TaxID=3155462 RepID=UPI0033CBD1DA
MSAGHGHSAPGPVGTGDTGRRHPASPASPTPPTGHGAPAAQGPDGGPCSGGSTGRDGGTGPEDGTGSGGGTGSAGPGAVPPLDGTALLRIAGVPCALWTAAGNPRLTERLADHAEAADRRAARAGSLAAGLGAVVPDPGLTDAERHAVLALRRRLHSGAAPRPGECGLLNRLPAVPERLAREAGELLRATRAATAAQSALERELAAERERAGALAWRLLDESPVLRAFVDTATPGLTTDIARILAEGETWTGKRLRKRSGYLWRAIARAAVKTTPRGWACHIATIPVEQPPPSAAPPADARAGTGTAPGAYGGTSGPGTPGVRGPAPVPTAAPTPTAAGGPASARPAGEPAARAGGRSPAAPAARSAGGDDPGAGTEAIARPGPVPHGPGGGAAGGRSPSSDGSSEGRTALLPPGAVVGALAATTAENVHLLRSRLTDADAWQRDPDVLVAPAALYTTDAEGRLQCYGADPDDPGRVRRVAVRRTPPLNAVLGILATGPRTLAELENAIAGPGGSPALRGFVGHLVRLGVLQPCLPPRRITGGWIAARDVRRPGALPYPAGTGRPHDWFTDSYRTVDATVPAAAADRVRHGLVVAARVDALRKADLAAGPATAPPYGHVLDAVGTAPRPADALLLELLAADAAEPAAVPVRRYEGWHPAHDPGSGYARLLARIDHHRDTGPDGGTDLSDLSDLSDTFDTFDIDHALLDALGAPPADQVLPAWPLDCLLRPLPGPAGPVAVLETASAARVLDARFAEALHTLHGRHDAVDAYRAFLAAVERHSGARFVELLLPPAGERAANAVRRPVTTGWWTGDPNHPAYCAPGGPPQRYLPLGRITLRRPPGPDGTPGPQVIAEADGVRVLPVHHATRVPAPPYDTLAALLLRAGHPAATAAVQLGGVAHAFPASAGITRTPRLTAGGDLVIAPATWRVPRSRLWPPRAGDLAKARALAVLTRTARLPRCVLVRPSAAAKPVPVDLAASSATTLIERLCAAIPGDELLIEEMLPDPGRLTLRDAAHHGAAVAGQLQLTVVPVRDPDELAALAAAALAPGVPGPPASGAAATGTVTTQQEEGARRSRAGRKQEFPCPSPN